LSARGRRTDSNTAETSVWIPTVDALRRRLYPDVLQRDPVANLVSRLTSVVQPSHRVLDLGAGAGERNAYSLKGKVRQIIGIDLDRRVTRNPLVDSGLRADIYALPFQSGSFDVVFSVYVFEHVDRPSELLEEIARVLRPGGICLVLTPNIFHYVTLLSRLTPTAFHQWVNKHRGRASEDTFPTRYRLNSRSALTQQVTAAGMDVVAIDAIEVQPNYLTFSPIAYLCGAVYERVVNASDSLSSMRVNLIGHFKKR
jgi:SAM-dependent methyltransferase